MSDTAKEDPRIAQLQSRIVELEKELAHAVEDRERVDALRVARDEALEASRAKSAFLANMSHELRTPLNAIIGYSELIAEDVADFDAPDMAADLQKIQVAARHLLSLINDILDLSKIEAGKMDLFLETFDVRQVVLDIAGTVQPLVEKGGNALIVECEARIGFMYADKTRIRQTLFNLLSNASRFTERGTITLTVEEVDFRGVEGLRFNVRDTGIGIPEDTIDRLFEAFTQGDQTPSRRYGGTGLGLAISRHFCAMMGGTLTAQSVVGEGSMFTIVLPRHVVDESARPEDDLLLRAQEDGGEALKAATTVLVIDDDPTVHDLMRRFLAREGYAVHSALTGRDGVQLAKTLHPDVITLDVMMPTMDGWAVLTELKSDPAVAAIPVVMVTMVQDEPMGYALGADEFLVKPIRRARLLDTLSRYRVGSGGLVLVVDDDTDARAMLSRMVSQEGWSVEQAANGVEALARLRRRQPDVILLDLMMPEMDGFEVLEHLQEDPEWREIPVIIVTAMTLAPDDLERLRGHIDRVLQKGTFTKDELLEGVAAVLRRVSEDLQRSQTG